MEGYVYILECVNTQYYVGSTTDVALRFQQHQNGEGSNFTRKYGPVKLVYVEICDCIEDAFKREKQIQGWSRKKKEALIFGNTNILHQLAECKNETHFSFKVKP